MSLSLRFFGDGWMPDELLCYQKDKNGLEGIISGKTHLYSFSAWRPTLAEQGGIQRGMLGPVATLYVNQPRIGIGYGINWRLPQNEVYPLASQLRGVRDMLKKRSANSSQHDFGKLSLEVSMMTRAIVYSQQSSEEAEPFVVTIHGYDDAEGIFYCYKSLPYNEFLHKHRIKYNRDCVGTCCRIVRPVFYSRRIAKSVLLNLPLSPAFREKVLSMASFPVFSREGLFFVVSVVSFEESEIASISENVEMGTRWALKIREVIGRALGE
jgi:hypothetical protein